MDVVSKIESLQVAPSWKQKFLAIAETKPIGGGLGISLKIKKNTKLCLFGQSLVYGVCSLGYCTTFSKVCGEKGWHS